MLELTQPTALGVPVPMCGASIGESVLTTRMMGRAALPER